ncbi:MAG TPA: serine/threonine-protein kinase [Kofleriaceae bacterium]|jgi:serine/threonine-protein kinase
MEGASIGPYRIVRKIGEGGMGAVFRAEHALLGRAAAIKVLLPALSQQREIVDRFFNEARATTSITDPGIVQVFDFGFHADGSAYIVMELLDGESLDARIARGTVAVVDALRITRQAAGSLAAAHARGIVHRDLKPDNLFIVRDPEAQGGERPKILDFGIAKLTGEFGGDRTRTRTGMLLGTPVYMSPEQCRGSGDVDHRSDIYSLGCVLYHLLVGRPPFDYEGVGEIISAHLREPPRLPSASLPGLPRAIDELVARCLAKDPGERFQTMTELQSACEGVLARISGTGAPTLALPGGPTRVGPTTLGASAGQVGEPRPARRLGWIAAAVAVVAAAAVALALALAPRGGDAPVPAEPAPPAAVHAAASVAPPRPPPDAAIPDAALADAALPDAAPGPLPPPPRPRRIVRSAPGPIAPKAEDPYDSR